jgi:[acyl-carrier-protein] S-malonyltransferase
VKPMPTAMLFAGQGSERVGMTASLPKDCEGCREALRTADRALGEPLSTLMSEGPDAVLRRTAFAQPALVTVAVAQAQHAIGQGLSPFLLAGHSLGQYAALVVAGSLSLEAAVVLVAERGRLMQEAVPEGQGAMAMISGLEHADVTVACERARAFGVVVIACFNAPRLVVISGEKAAVVAVADASEELDATAAPLPVSAPFHCPLLRSMVPAFRELVEQADIDAPRIPVIDNVSARPLTTAREVKDALIAQIEAPVRFEDSLRLMAAQGASRFVSCGPGSGPLAFAKRTCPGAELLSFKAACEALEGDDDVARRPIH